MPHLKPAIFLDRDGVVIEECHYLNSPELVRLVPGSAEAIAAINRAGWPVVLVTNQSGIGRGLFTRATMAAVHDHLQALLHGYGARVDGIYFCPHHPAADLAEYRCECECRKPRPGMLLRAGMELGLDLVRSWMIGDQATDLEAGANAGCRTVLVRTGYGATLNAAALNRDELHLDLIAADLADAVRKLGLSSRRSAA